jgi:Xaa-Pro aminopeptidase
MLFDFGKTHDIAVYAGRRKSLVQAIKDEWEKSGPVLLIGGFESGTTRFEQESSFFYFTGVTEPGAALLIDRQGKSTLYIPHYAQSRSVWVTHALEKTAECAKKIGVDHIEYLGDVCKGYMFGPYFKQEQYAAIIEAIKSLGAGDMVYSCTPGSMHEYIEQRLVLKQLQEMVPGLAAQLQDISGIVADLRSSKDMGEIELIKAAIDITIVAQQAAAQTVAHEVSEREIQAALEGVMTMAGARPAFSSIIASGKRSTVLHAIDNDQVMNTGDLVVVDIGARFQGYAADLTRTYPVSGTFSKRQREVYDIVLAAQEFVADKARPGVWLFNADKPEQSLHHMAQKFFAERGYGQYFTHKIGHYLGLDVHDVGDYSRPLREGDVITIEPGLYIAAENIGIRIEDDYWIVKNGAICLSEELPKTAEEIQQFMQESMQDDDTSFEDFEEEDDEDYEIEH